jgi:tetratricopeptide (TPR) repeat protein
MFEFRRLTAFLATAAFIIVGSSAVRADENRQLSAGGHLLEAEVAMQADDYLKASQEYRKAAELSDSPDIARRATRTAFALGFNDDAVLAAKRWRELDSASDEARMYIAQLELRLGNFKAARAAFGELIETAGPSPEQSLVALLPILADEDPESVDRLMRALAKPYKDSALAHYAVAATALQAGDTEHAAKRAESAMALDPAWIKPKLLYARVLLVDGDADAAIDFTARIIGDDPNPDPDARMELALMMLAEGRDEDALSQVNQVLLEQAGRADALRLMAIINFRLNNLDAAGADFQDLLASGRYTMDALYYLARIADIREDRDQAIRLYLQVKSGNNAVLAHRRASWLIAFKEEDPELALQRLDELGDANPQLAIEAVVARALLLSALERYDEALAAYDLAVSSRPDDEGIALNRAELFLRMGRLDDALAAYRDAARRWPDSALSLNALGYTLADRTDEYREAEKLIRKALKFDPNSPAILDSFGWVLHKRGRHEAALEQLEAAYEQFPDHEVAAHLVEVLVVLGRNEEAAKLLAEAELKDPDSKLLQKVRERFFPETE